MSVLLLLGSLPGKVSYAKEATDLSSPAAQNEAARTYVTLFEGLPEWITPLPYHISGGTRQELRQAIRQASVHSPEDTDRSDFGAVIMSSYAYEIQSERTTPAENRSGTWTCTASGSVAVSLSVSIRYPVWDNLQVCPDSGLVRGWKHYMAALYHHEIGHVYIARAGLRRLERELRDLEVTADAASSTAACALAGREYRQLIEGDFERITAAIAQTHQDYDIRTDYGRNQGASF